VAGVCQLLDKAVEQPPPLSILDRGRVAIARLVDVVTGRVIRSHSPAPWSISPSTADAHRISGEELPETLATQGRWHALKHVIDDREKRGIPLRQLASLKPDIARRHEAFERARVKAMAAIEYHGPGAADPYIARMREAMPDHPDIQNVTQRAALVQSALATLHRSWDRFCREDRWIAAEGAIRDVAHSHGLVTTDLLNNAEKAATGAAKETNRFDLLTWTIAVGLTIVLLVGVVQMWFGAAAAGQDVGTARQVAVAVRLVTLATITTAGLSVYGRRPSGTTVGFSLLFMFMAALVEVFVVAVGAAARTEAAPPILTRASGWMPSFEAGAISFLLLMLMLMPTTDLVSKKRKLPGLSALALTIVVAGGLIPPNNPMQWSPTWCTFLPDALVATTLLAVSGLIQSSQAWLVLPIVALLTGMYGISPDGSWPRLWNLDIPLFGILFISGGLAVGRLSFWGHAWAFLVVVAAVTAGSLCRMADARIADPALATFGPLVSLWAIACGSTALRQEQQLGSLRVFDCLQKLLSLRVAYAGSKLAGPRLTESEWYRSGRAWHDRAKRREGRA
jgi:hypothetical protein